MKKYYYAVVSGFKTGIFTDWYGHGGAEEQINGFSRARFKGFSTKKQAEEWYEKNRIDIYPSKVKRIRIKRQL